MVGGETDCWMVQKSSNPTPLAKTSEEGDRAGDVADANQSQSLSTIFLSISVRPVPLSISVDFSTLVPGISQNR